MQSSILPEYTIEIDIDKDLCNLDHIQEISFEFANFFRQKLTDEEKKTFNRIIDIDLNDLVIKNISNSNEINAEINGQDTIIKTSNSSNSEDEIDILQMDDEPFFPNLQKMQISLSDQSFSQSLVEI